MKPSTRLGNLLGACMRASAYLLDYALPIGAVSAYRLIPDGSRGALFGGPSASLEAVRAIRAMRGNGWAVIRQIAVSNHPERPTLP
jgi:hypothetical protein